MSFNQWDLKSIGEIGDVITGKTPSTKNEKNFGDMCYFITPRDMTGQKKIDFTERKLSPDGIESVKKQFIKGPAICVSCIGSDMGKVVICENDFVTNQQINTISNIKGNYDIDFLYYSLKPMKDYLHGIAGGSTMPIVNKSTFETIKISVPTLNQQKAIAKVLSDLDEKIEINNKINRKLEEMAQAIFKQWFVDFEFPNEDGKPYKSSGGEMVESELGIIPKGWKVGSIYEVANVIYGAPFSSKKFNEDKIGLPLIRIRDLKTAKPSFYTEEKHKNATKVKTGDILVGMDAEFTPTIWRGNEGYLNQRVCMFKSNKDYLHDYFIYEIIKPYMNLMEFSKVGTTVIHLGKGDIDNMKIVIPKRDILKLFYKIIDPIYSKLIEVANENRILTDLRDTLLPKLMSGEIRVPID